MAEPSETAAVEADAPGWRCIVLTRAEIGTGRGKHVVYDAQSQSCGQPPQALRFRFSELVSMRNQLETVPELRDVDLPRLPPKVTLRSVFAGRFDESFIEERLSLVQQFFDTLALRLGEKYAGVGDCTDLCEPLGVFVRKAASLGETAELSAAEAAARVATQAEDREIIAEQNDEFEESLRMDELRAVEQLERQAAERETAKRAEEEKQAERQAAEEQATDLLRRRAAFEERCVAPLAGTVQANLRFKASSGATLTRVFPGSVLVSELFEFVFVTEWTAAPTRSFDLRLSFPVKSLKANKEQTLEEAGLCPSVAVLVVEDEEEE